MHKPRLLSFLGPPLQRNTVSCNKADNLAHVFSLLSHTHRRNLHEIRAHREQSLSPTLAPTLVPKKWGNHTESSCCWQWIRQI